MTGSIEDTTEKLIDAGVLAVQYRNKKGISREVLATARILGGIACPRAVHFFVNDRADIAQLSGASGVHVGQEDLGAERARAVIGAEGWIGVSTHNEMQFRAAAQTSGRASKRASSRRYPSRWTGTTF
jgi:thiamine-phosphate pyrophosphorylase